MFVLTLTAAR